MKIKEIINKIKEYLKTTFDIKRNGFFDFIKKNISLKFFLFIFLIPFISFIFFTQIVNYFFNFYTGPNTYFLSNNISLQTKDEVTSLIQKEKEKMLKDKVVFSYINKDGNNVSKSVMLKDLIQVDYSEKILDQIFKNNFNPYNIDLRLLAYNLSFKKNNYKIDYYINEEKIKSIEDEFKTQEDKKIDSFISFDVEKNYFKTNKEKEGFYFDFKEIQNDLLDVINSDKISDIINIKINKIVDDPKVKEPQLQDAVQRSNTFLDNSGLSLYYKDKQYKIIRDNIKDYIEFKYNFDISGNFEEANININKDKLLEYLVVISKENDKLPNNGELEIKNEKVIKFVPTSKGLSLDKEDSYNKIQDAILTGKKEIFLTINEVDPTDINSDVIKYGFIEKIAEGTSDFKGSPANRVVNIKTGSSFVNGTIIKPNEPFSMMKVLGVINGSKGYVQELVIKGSKTEKEYGGGLCQVGTTMFRAALDGGFPILERSNHSYRVPYYEPAGTDATIYYPKPDFKFLNNTKSNILVTTEMRDNHTLIFSIWGTRDNRKIKIGKPVVTNIVPAPRTKYIETLDLKPGQIRCTETSHDGATAQFDYLVEYEDGTKFEKNFVSKYRPWQAICLKGVEKLSNPSGYGYGTEVLTTPDSAAQDTQVVGY